MKNWKGIVLHCSDSEWGSATLIDEWHKINGWDGIGYHFVICNGKVRSKTTLNFMDGNIEYGRSLEKQGAHATGYNTDYIGICLIGKHIFTVRQRESLHKLVQYLMTRYDIDISNVIGHYECEGTTKTCPNFDVQEFRNEF
jgi:N-acetylmuramoyl-L-alanine amidase